MGDYARIKKTGEEVKIGTCGSNYYLRHDQKNEIENVNGKKYNFEGESFRLIFEDEKNIKPGHFDNYNRGIRFYNSIDFFTPEQIENLKPGIMQFSKNGLLLNVPCYHNLKLPNNTGDIKAFFNGRAEVFEVTRIKEIDKKLTLIIRCTNCGDEFYLDFDEIEKIETHYKDFQINLDYILSYNCESFDKSPCIQKEVQQ
jgi:hypothetical protein